MCSVAHSITQIAFWNQRHCSSAPVVVVAGLRELTREQRDLEPGAIESGRVPSLFAQMW